MASSIFHIKCCKRDYAAISMYMWQKMVAFVQIMITRPCLIIEGFHSVLLYRKGAIGVSVIQTVNIHGNAQGGLRTGVSLLHSTFSSLLNKQGASEVC